ncbi:MAG: DUF979 domain-containing protein [Acidobacteriota bacterium]
MMIAVSLSQIMREVVSLNGVYALTGAVLMIFAVMTWRDRTNPHRRTSAGFWFLLGVIFAGGSFLPYRVTGLLVLAMVALDGAKRVTRGKSEETSKEDQSRRADTLRNKIFLPVLSIPVTVLIFALACRVEAVSKFLGMDASRGAIVGLGFGGVVAMAMALMITKGSCRQMMEEGRRINDAMGTVSILPQLLASLGVIFTAAKIGDLIAQGIQTVVPEGNLFLLVLTNCLGMTMFTVVVGNSFAAFPVIATGVLSPLIIQPYGVDPAMVGIITLTAGSSGTLMTPMAANFNVVPTALLNMKDQYGVIKFQLPYAMAIWTLHVVLMWAMIKLF